MIDSRYDGSMDGWIDINRDEKKRKKKGKGKGGRKGVPRCWQPSEYKKLHVKATAMGLEANGVEIIKSGQTFKEAQLGLRGAAYGKDQR